MVAPFHGDGEVIWNHLVPLCCRRCKNIYKEVSKDVNFDAHHLNITAASEFSLEGGNTAVILVRGEMIHAGSTKTFVRHCIACENKSWSDFFCRLFRELASCAPTERAFGGRGRIAEECVMLRPVTDVHYVVALVRDNNEHVCC